MDFFDWIRDSNFVLSEFLNEINKRKYFCEKKKKKKEKKRKKKERKKEKVRLNRFN